MINVIISFGMVILLFISGKIYESIKRLLILFVDIILKVLNLFGIKISRTEHKVKITQEFKRVFKDIRVVKQSKENIKLKPSINIVAFILLVLSVTLVVLNFNSISGNAISKWLFKHNLFPVFITTKEQMDTTLTATLFSIIAFSISKLANQWKETAKYRQARREMRRRELVIAKMTAKDLLDAAKLKDEEAYNKFIQQNNKNNQDEQNIKRNTKSNAKSF